MKIGEVIRKNRKEKTMTQEEVAGRLGVTASAVNKWENGNSYPDITLIAPLARLFGISTDMLLCYKEDLTEQEINRMLERVGEKIEKEGYESAFCFAEGCLQEYPNCDRLLLLTAQSLDGYRIIYTPKQAQEYEEKIYKLYLRALQSKEEEIVQTAAVFLVQCAIAKKEYEKAQEYLDLLTKRNYVNPKQLQANLYFSQGKTEEAYPIYEQIVFAGFNEINMALEGIVRLAIEEQDMEKAKQIVEKQKELAKILEMGTYMEVSPGLGLALQFQDKEELLSILENIVHSVDKMNEFCQSELYSHMKFSDNGTENLVLMLQKAFESDESLDFIKEEERFSRLMQELDKIGNNKG